MLSKSYGAVKAVRDFSVKLVSNKITIDDMANANVAVTMQIIIICADTAVTKIERDMICMLSSLNIGIVFPSNVNKVQPASWNSLKTVLQSF